MTLPSPKTETLWSRGYTGRGITVGHLDTGVDAAHPALADRVAAFRLFDEDGEPAAVPEPVDTAAHGTHTAGLVCGASSSRVIGAAPEARLHAAAVISKGKNLVRVLRGLDWLLDSGVRVVVMALGSDTFNPVLYPMLQAARTAGILILCPIGNRGPGQAHVPGSYANVFSIGACDREGRPAAFSGSLVSRGACVKPDVLAPGIDMLSADVRSGALRAKDGTSQAAAFAAGVAALLVQARPGATVGQLEHALAQSCTPAGDPGLESSRFGSVDPVRALDVLLEAPASVAVAPVLKPERARFRDPELQRELGGSRRRQDCIVVAAEDVPGDEERGAAGTVLDRLETTIGEKAARVYYLPRARTAVVTGSARLVRSLIASDLALMVSATRATNNPFMG